MRDSYTNRNQCPSHDMWSYEFWEGWSLVRVVVRQGFYCNSNTWYDVWCHELINHHLEYEVTPRIIHNCNIFGYTQTSFIMTKGQQYEVTHRYCLAWLKISLMLINYQWGSKVRIRNYHNVMSFLIQYMTLWRPYLKIVIIQDRPKGQEMY